MEQDQELLRHSAAHVLAAALCRLYKDIQLDIGPATDTGFYYDVDLDRPLTEEDLVTLEARMLEQIRRNLHLTEKVSSRPGRRKGRPG